MLLAVGFFLPLAVGNFGIQLGQPPGIGHNPGMPQREPREAAPPQ
jgi:hypothetical protein